MNLLRGKYAAGDIPAEGQLYVLEGVSGIGKSTLSALLAERLGGTTLHTLPEPLTAWSAQVNSALRPLPQLGFYLSGLLHASDLVRNSLTHGHVVADRYTSSVIACHAAVHGLDIGQVAGLLVPFQPYLVAPTRTFYLRASESTLRERLRTKTDLKQDDTDLFSIPGRLKALLVNFDAIAKRDPSAVVLDTDGRTPNQLAALINEKLEQPDA
ncbi:thymidylate kinase [Streptomyces sp. CC77]|uniref:dTMP kinase n=1 Tax=Streptomyces sp. CC77 TaxID=1906739 RepID=UPI0008DCFCC5|nr:thymidylate kinase [Streptomyces sp. CC77]OII63778.1 thymidylate kinase [Streptomyces sp. CC77]